MQKTKKRFRLLEGKKIMKNEPVHSRHHRHLKKCAKQILEITLVFVVIVAILPFSAWIINGRSASENRRIDKLSESFKPHSSDENADRLAEANVFLTKYKTDINQNKIVAATESGSDLILATAPEKSMDYGPIHVLTYDSSDQADKAAVDLQNEKIPASSADVEFHVALGDDSEQVYPYQMQMQAKKATENKTDEPLIALIDTGDNNADKSVNLTRESDADRNGHGTRMDKLIREGAGRKVQILSIKAFSDEGTANLSDMAAAICYAVDSGADIINISATAEATQHGREVLQVVIDEAFQKGITIVAAAGNSSADAGNYMPACLHHVITVGAADETGKLSSYSNYGDSIDLYVKGQEYTSSAAARITGYIAGSNEIALSAHKDVAVKAENIPAEKANPSASAESLSESEPESTEPVGSVETASAEPESTSVVKEKAEESTEPDEDNKPEVSAESESISQEEASAEETAASDKDTREESTVEPEEKKQTVDESAGKDNEKPIENAEATNDKETDQSSETEKSALPADTAEPSEKKENRDDEFKVSDNGEQTHATGYIESLDDDDEYIEMFKILEQDDGTEPWDSNDDPGNDSNASNNIVRTFDYLDYTLQFTSAPYTDGAYYRNGYIRFKMVLPMTPSEAVFNTGAMGWMISGTGTDYDWQIKTETVNGQESQVLYCAMKLSADTAGTANVLPCIKQTAFVSIQVTNAKANQKFTPLFSVWMDHNTTDGTCTQHNKNEVVSVSGDEITVSAAPSYNVWVSTEGTVPIKNYDFNTGDSNAPNKGIGQQHGYIAVFGTLIELRNTGNSQKKLRGVEIPTGPISFDLDLDYYMIDSNGHRQALSGVTINPMIWSYGGNNGHLFGRTTGTEPWGLPHNFPNGSGGGQNGVVNSGNTAAVLSGDGKTLSVSTTDYEINDKYFPVKQTYGAATASVFYNNADYGKGALYTNRGVFISLEYCLFVGFNTEELYARYGASSLCVSAKLNNLKTTSLSGNTANSDIVTTDDSATASREIRGPGRYDHMINYCRLYSSNTNVQGQVDDYGSADDMGLTGQKISIRMIASIVDTETDFNAGEDRLVKFDASAITPPSLPYRGDLAWAAKPDGTDWISDEEKDLTGFDDLVYYKTYEELKAAGKKCVGFVQSARHRNKNYFNNTWTDDVRIDGFTINSDAALNNTVHSVVIMSNVYSVDLTSSGFTDDDLNIPYFNEAYFNGASLPEPSMKNWTSVKRYYKAEYKDDVRISNGNHAFDLGDSLYIKTYMAYINKYIEQTSQGKEKAHFNLDNGETIVDYKLSAYTSSHLNMKTAFTITDTIPKGLIYNNDSTYGGTYEKGATDGAHGTIKDGVSITPAITKNSDGSETLVWTMKNVDLSQAIPEIHYSCTIDKDAAKNNQEFLNTASVKTTEDQRSPSIYAGNLTDKTFKVIKLSGFAISKTADKEIYEVPDDISWTMTWNNQSKNKEPDVLMMDMMPYNGDNFGSNYHGSYTVKSLKLDLDTPSAYTFWYTTDESYRGKSTRDITSDDVRANWTQGNITSDGTVSCLNGKTPVAWGFIGTLNGNTSLVGHITIQTTGAKADDDYYNESSMMKAVVSGHSAYVSHNLSGYVFIDTDKDGFKDDTETVLKGVTATLYEKGNHTKPVTNIDGKACVAATDDKGYYEFINIPKRDYDVVFTKDDLSLYALTPKYTDHEGWTNKATHEDDDGDGLVRDMYIDSAIDRSLEAQQRDVLSRITYRVDYTQVNLGIYQRTSKVMIQKTDTDGKILPGADLQIADSDGHVLVTWTSSENPYTWTLIWGKTYTVTETKAPAGHALTAGSVTIQINKNGKLVVNGKAVDGYKITLADADSLHVLSTGGEGTRMIMLAGSIVATVGVVLLIMRKKKACNR